MSERSETIFALSTPPGIGAIAVIRVSGPAADEALARLIGGNAGDLPRLRRATRTSLQGPDGERLDDALVLRFAQGASYTGEPLVELHCHGGRAVVAAVLGALERMDGLRPAEPGEFTARAWLNGRMDLTEVEALSDLIAAETESQRRAAVAGASGALKRRADTWREALVEALALTEATIDWADEEVPDDLLPEVAEVLNRLAGSLAAELAGSAAAERLREGFEVVLLGAPNAGKSTLLNAIAGREVALTAATPGTTRDALEVRLDLRGIPVTLVDTAGLRETSEAVEAAGIARAIDRACGADLRILLEAPDATVPTGPWDETVGAGDLRVATKADLGMGGRDVLAVSAVNGAGIEALLDEIAERLTGRVAAATLIGHSRQRSAVAAAARAVEEARVGLATDGVEITAERLRDAARALERLTGRIGAEDVLDGVFGRFCLGK